MFGVFGSRHQTHQLNSTRGETQFLTCSEHLMLTLYLQEVCVWLYRPTCRALAVAAVHGGPADSRAGLHSGVATSAAILTGSARAALASAAVDSGAGAGGWKRAVLSMLMAAGLAVALVMGMPSVAYARQLLPVEAAPATLEMKVRCADGRICLATGWCWVGLWGFLRASQGVYATLRGLYLAGCVSLLGSCPHVMEGVLPVSAVVGGRCLRLWRNAVPGPQAQSRGAVARGAADGGALPGKHAVRREHCQHWYGVSLIQPMHICSFSLELHWWDVEAESSSACAIIVGLYVSMLS